MDRWTGRVALVTGASAGIGEAITKALVKNGMKVVGCARNEDKLKALAAELKGEKGELHAVRCDISLDDEVLSMFAWIKKQFGGLDVCINNAGVAKGGPLLDGDPKIWRELLNVNVVALCLCTREAIKSMKEKGVDDGHIIHIGSQLGHEVIPFSPTHFYASTKWAVRALTEGLRQELREMNSHIRVTELSPGAVDTNFANRKDPELQKKLHSKLSNIFPLQAEDLANTVVHVLSAPPHVQIHDIIVTAIK